MIFQNETFMEIPSVNLVDQSDYMWIDPRSGSLITAIVVDKAPLRFISESSSYKEIRSSLVEVRSFRSSQWTEHLCNVDDDMVWWTINGKCHGWRIIPFVMVPELAQRAFLRGRAKLIGSE